MTAQLPPGWPDGVQPPGSPDFEATAVAWLLDVVPPTTGSTGCCAVTRSPWPGTTSRPASREPAKATGPPGLSWARHSPRPLSTRCSLCTGAKDSAWWPPPPPSS